MAFNNNNDNLTYHNDPDYNNKKFENIKSIEELTHSFISQPNPNEFHIALSECSETCCSLCFSAIFGAPAVGLVIYIIFASHYNAKKVYTGIAVSALFCFFLIILTIIDLIQSIKRIKITLESDGLKSIKIYLCPCRHDKEIVTTGIQKFEMDYDEKTKTLISINYHDINYKERQLLIQRAFSEDEAGYLIYVLNKYLQENSSKFASPLSQYNNY